MALNPPPGRGMGVAGSSALPVPWQEATTVFLFSTTDRAIWACLDHRCTPSTSFAQRTGSSAHTARCSTWRMCAAAPAAIPSSQSVMPPKRPHHGQYGHTRHAGRHPCSGPDQNHRRTLRHPVRHHQPFVLVQLPALERQPVTLQALAQSLLHGLPEHRHRVGRSHLHPEEGAGQLSHVNLHEHLRTKGTWGGHTATRTGNHRSPHTVTMVLSRPASSRRHLMTTPPDPHDEVECCPVLTRCQPVHQIRPAYRMIHTVPGADGQAPVRVEASWHLTLTNATGPTMLGPVVKTVTLMPGQTVRLSIQDRASKFSYDTESDRVHRESHTSAS